MQPARGGLFISDRITPTLNGTDTGVVRRPPSNRRPAFDSIDPLQLKPVQYSGNLSAGGQALRVQPALLVPLENALAYRPGHGRLCPIMHLSLIHI